jgi:sugar (pentulose or hexulose) kinase
MSGYHIVVLDVGKTNKKLFVYDSDLHCLESDEAGAVFPESICDIGGERVRCDDVAAVRRWMLDGLTRAASRHKDIRAISICAHGATIALLGAGEGRVFPGDGGLVFPVVSYVHDVGAAEDEAFYADMGMSPEDVQRETATARFGWFLNHAKQVWWLAKRFPMLFPQVTDILMYPQYLGYLLTGEKGAEPTYLGCHGGLLDASGEWYSVVAERLGVTRLLPRFPLRCTWEPLGKLKPELARETGLSPETIVTMGAHDSNAALVPYFVKGYDDFVVQDSGTWVVTMAPSREARFEEGELGKEVFFNRSIYGTPIKTTIFRGGAEFEFCRTKVLPQYSHPEAIDEGVLREVLDKREAFALPTLERGSGLFPSSVARLVGTDTIFRDAVTAWTVVDLGLAVQGYLAIRMAGGESPARIFIEGNIGRSNPLYRSTISTLFPKSAVSFGSSGGAAYGAAVLGAAAVEGCRPEGLAARVTLEAREVPKLKGALQPLKRYARAFVRQVR